MGLQHRSNPDFDVKPRLRNQKLCSVKEPVTYDEVHSKLRKATYSEYAGEEMTDGKPESTRTSTTGLSTAVTLMSARQSTAVPVINASRVATTLTA